MRRGDASGAGAGAHAAAVSTRAVRATGTARTGIEGLDVKYVPGLSTLDTLRGWLLVVTTAGT
eukprot:4988713-Prymnesium_polylepis.1